MTSPPESPLSVLKRESTTFHWASKFFPKSEREELAQLYTFCRKLDNVADEGVDPDQARKKLQDVREDLQTENFETSDHFAVQLYGELHGSGDLRLQPALDLVDGLIGDLGPVRFSTRDQLLEYAYRVAGTVGLMINDLLGVKQEADPHAVALGMGMQISNITRDLREDYARDRIYLPKEVIPHERVMRVLENEPSGGDLEALEQAREEMIDLAAQFYRHSDGGIRYLPMRVRPGVFLAGRCYEAIGTHTLNRDVRNPIEDVPIPVPKLVMITLFAFLQVLVRYDLNGLAPASQRELPHAETLPVEI